LFLPDAELQPASKPTKETHALKRTIYLAVVASLPLLAQDGFRAARGRAIEVRPHEYISTFKDTIPWFAFGGGWNARVALLNFRSTPVDVTLHFYDATGAAVKAPLKDIGSTSSTTTTIPPHGVALFATTASAGSPLVGGMLKLDIPCTSDACGDVGAYAVLRDEVMKQEAVVTASSSDENTAVVAFDNRNGYSTGVAAACPDFFSFGAPCSAFVTIRDQNGNIIKTDVVTIPLDGVMSATLPDRYPEVRGIAGTIEFGVTSGSVTALAYVFSPTGAFTSSPVFQPSL
jgi:hypothetical protein